MKAVLVLKIHLRRFLRFKQKHQTQKNVSVTFPENSPTWKLRKIIYNWQTFAAENLARSVLLFRHIPALNLFQIFFPPQLHANNTILTKKISGSFSQKWKKKNNTPTFKSSYSTRRKIERAEFNYGNKRNSFLPSYHDHFEYSYVQIHTNSESWLLFKILLVIFFFGEDVWVNGNLLPWQKNK